MYTDIEAIEHIERVMGIKFSEEQRQIMSHHGGMCILACAGSGKTTTLSAFLVKRILTNEIDPSTMLCCTYSKGGSEELESRINNLLKKLGINKKVCVKTLHASYYMILQQYGVVMNTITWERKVYIKDAVKEVGLRLEQEDLDTIDSLLSYQVNNLMSDEALYNSCQYTLDNVSCEQYSKIRQLYSEKKQAKQQIDFDDMQMYMYVLMCVNKRQDIIDYCKSIWKYVAIDEFQDTSKIQFEILRVLVDNPDNLVVIGDDDQCIYDWRGSDPSIILNICGYFDIKKFILGTNYRCRGNIVDKAAHGIKFLAKREEKQMKSFKQGGIVKVMLSQANDIARMSRQVADHIERLIDSKRYTADEICVLCRNNIHGAILSNILLHKNIYTESVKEMHMSKTRVFNDYVNILEIVNDTYNHNIVYDIIWKIVPFLGLKGAGLIKRFMDETGCSLLNTIGYIVNRSAYNMPSDVKPLHDIKVPEIIKKKLEYSVASIPVKAIEGLITIYRVLYDSTVNTDISDEIKRISMLTHEYLAGMQFMYKSRDGQRMLYGIINYLNSVVKEYGLSDTKSFIRMTKQIESGDMGLLGSKVEIRTMHGAKGKEWKHVIIFADDNICFPNFDHMANSLNNGVSYSDISQYVDSERRLHYVAMTRAKEELLVVTDIKHASVFLMESLGLLDNEKDTNDLAILWAQKGAYPPEVSNQVMELLCDESSDIYYHV